MHNDVDNYPSSWGKWDHKPTLDNIKHTLKDYYSDPELSELADELFENGQVDVNNCECTTFEIQEI